MSDDARFCTGCGNELKDDDILSEQVGLNMEEKSASKYEPYQENITKKNDGNKGIYKIVAIILILLIIVAVYFVGRKIIGVDGTYYREGSSSEYLILRGGTAYSDGMVLCSYEKSGSTIMFYTNDGIYYGTYDWNEGKLYVDDTVFVKHRMWNADDTRDDTKDDYSVERLPEGEMFNIEDHYGIYIDDEISIVDDSAYALETDSVRNILEHAEQMAALSGYNIMIVITDDDCEEGVTVYADNYYDSKLDEFQNQYSLDDDGYVFIINTNIRTYTISTCGKAINYYTDEKIDELLNDLSVKMEDGDYEGAVIQLIDGTLY